MFYHARFCHLNLRVLGIHDRLQNGRTIYRPGRQHQFLRRTVIIICNIAGLWKPTGWRLLWCMLLSILCVVQFGMQIYNDIKESSLHHNESDHAQNISDICCWNMSMQKPISHLKPSASTLMSIAFTLSSIGSAFSYLLLLYCFMTKIRRLNNCAMAPWEAIDDLSLAKLRILIIIFVIVLVVFLASLVDFIIEVNRQPISFDIDIIGSIFHFLSHFVALVGCFVFAICTLALGKSQPCLGCLTQTLVAGTLANDTIRRIRATCCSLDMLIEIHEELCDIVVATVSAFAPWFLVHWLIYAAVVIVSVVFVTIEYAQDPQAKDNPIVWFLAVATVNYLIIFLLPCFFAAYVTTTCGGIASKINKTTAKDWPVSHPFRQRTNVHLFSSYAKDRQCVFKIGRITFTSTIAWVSLLLASIGLVLRVIK